MAQPEIVHHYLYCPSIRSEETDARCTCWEELQRNTRGRVELPLETYEQMSATIARLEAERAEWREWHDHELKVSQEYRRQRDELGASAARMREALVAIELHNTDADNFCTVCDSGDEEHNLGCPFLALADPAPLEWLAARDAEAVEPYRRVLLRMFVFHPAMDARHVVRGTEEGGKCGSCGFPWPCPYVEARALAAGRAGTEAHQ